MAVSPQVVRFIAVPVFLVRCRCGCVAFSSPPCTDSPLAFGVGRFFRVARALSAISTVSRSSAALRNTLKAVSGLFSDLRLCTPCAALSVQTHAVYSCHQCLGDDGRGSFPVAPIFITLKVSFRGVTSEVLLQCCINRIHTVTRFGLIPHFYDTRDFRCHLGRVHLCPLSTSPVATQSLHL